MKTNNENIRYFDVSSIERLMEALRFAYSNNKGIVVETSLVKTMLRLLEDELYELYELRSRVRW